LHRIYMFLGKAYRFLSTSAGQKGVALNVNAHHAPYKAIDPNITLKGSACRRNIRGAWLMNRRYLYPGI
jgi:hypothetical protein